MANITVKNIPDGIYRDLKQMAVEQRRSVNSEIIHLIEQATTSVRIDPQQYLARVQSFREKTGAYKLNEARMKRIKSEGRP